MRQAGSAASFEIGEGGEIDDLVGQVNGTANGPHRSTSVPPMVAPSSALPATTTDKTAVLAWLADRLRWERRLEELRVAHAAELEHSARTAGESAWLPTYPA